MSYESDVISRLWEYKIKYFPNKYFKRNIRSNNKAPIFKKCKESHNLLFNPHSKAKYKELLKLIEKKDRHRYFGDMKSSQALAQSILGNLCVYNLMEKVLFSLKDDNGYDLIDSKCVINFSNRFSMEHEITYLNEPRPTKLDGYIEGCYRIAIECKFTEQNFGSCSQTGNRINKKYKCNNNYIVQSSRTERCSLTEKGIKYWDFIPDLFRWDQYKDICPCPINKNNYQLVRNILAIGVNSYGVTNTNQGHVLVLYDENNPSFQKGGECLNAFEWTWNALREPAMLRKCSWQRIVKQIRIQKYLPWLTDQIYEKYGF